MVQTTFYLKQVYSILAVSPCIESPISWQRTCEIITVLVEVCNRTMPPVLWVGNSLHDCHISGQDSDLLTYLPVIYIYFDFIDYRDKNRLELGLLNSAVFHVRLFAAKMFEYSNIRRSPTLYIYMRPKKIH